jgi:hypothetical protein
MQNFRYLNLNIPLFNEGVSINSFPKCNIAIIDKEKLIHPEIFKFFDSLGLQIFFVESFFKYPGNGIIHTDAASGDYTKLNWVFGNGDAKMIWYKTKENIVKTSLKNIAEKTYLKYFQHEVDEIERAVIKNPTLVQVGIPHNIIDITEDRLCISIIFIDKISLKRPTMLESLIRLKDYLS